MNRAPMNLNHYQQLMLQLSMDSPYNAVHAIPVNPSLHSAPALQNSINAILHQLGLGLPQFSSDTQQVTFIPLSAPIELHFRHAPLNQHAELEINHFFPLNACPLRFFFSGRLLYFIFFNYL
jgi:hypothetical protein